MTFNITSQTLGVNVNAVSATDNGVPLGTRVMGTSGVEMIRVKANDTSAVPAKKLAGFDETFTLYPLTSARAAAGMGIAAPQIAFAVDEYGWAPILGPVGSIYAKKSCAADSALYLTSTPGVVDDTATGHLQVVGALLISAASSDSGYFGCRFLTYPMANKFADRDAGGV